MLLSHFFSLCASFFNEFERFCTGILQFKFCMTVEICIKLPTFKDIYTLSTGMMRAQGMMDYCLFWP